MIRVLRSYEARLERMFRNGEWVVIATTPPVRVGKVLRQVGRELAISRMDGSLTFLDRVPVEAVDLVCSTENDANALLRLIELMNRRRAKWNLDDLVNAARCAGDMQT